MSTNKGRGRDVKEYKHGSAYLNDWSSKEYSHCKRNEYLDVKTTVGVKEERYYQSIMDDMWKDMRLVIIWSFNRVWRGRRFSDVGGTLDD